MPIAGLTDSIRIPRLGKIHLGVKKVSLKTGKEYPVATDYFVCDAPPFQAVYPGEPKTLEVRFPLEDPNLFASQWYKAYSRTRGLICRGDGRLADRLVFKDAMQHSDNAPAEYDPTGKRETTWINVDCRGKDCPIYQAKGCRELMMLQFLLPRVDGFGIWQIDTSSINSILNINNAVRLIQSIGGWVRMVPLNLSLVPQEVTADGKKKTVHVLRLDIAVSLEELMAQPQRLSLSVGKEVIPPGDDGPPEDYEGLQGNGSHTEAQAVVEESAPIAEPPPAEHQEPSKPPREPAVKSPTQAALDAQFETPVQTVGTAEPLSGRKPPPALLAECATYVRDMQAYGVRNVVMPPSGATKTEVAEFVAGLRSRLAELKKNVDLGEDK